MARSGAVGAGRRRAPAPEEPLARALGQRLDVARGDVQERHLGVGGQEPAASSTVASQVSSTIQTSARISGQALRAEP